MGSHSAIVLDVCEVCDLSDRVLADIVSSVETLSIEVPMPCIGFTNEPDDIADDYLYASFLGERLAPMCRQISVSPIEQEYGRLSLRFTLNLNKKQSLATELHRIAPLFDDEREADQVVHDELGNFYDSYFDQQLCLPILGDNYMANLVCGSRYSENRAEWHSRIAHKPES